MKESPTLFLEFHGTEAGIDAQTAAVAEIAKDNGGSDFAMSVRPEERNKLWTARHKLYYAALALRPGCKSVTTDVAVPVTELPHNLVQASKDIEEAGLTGQSKQVSATTVPSAQKKGFLGLRRTAR